MRTIQRRAARVALECVIALLGSAVGVARAAPQCSPVEVAGLTPPDGSPADLFGQSVSVDGNTLVVGSPRDDDKGLNAGSAYVFVRDSAGSRTWRRTAKLLAPDGEAGDEFGQGVSVHGDFIVVGAWGDDDNGTGSGSAYVFQRKGGDDGAWSSAAKLLASDGSPSALFGYAVSVFGETVTVGADLATFNGVQAGEAYVFERNLGGPNMWGEIAKLHAPNPAIGDSFGGYVSLSGDSVAVGAPGDDEKAPQAGAAYVFNRNVGGQNGWGLVKKLFAADATAGDQFGAVSLSGETLLAGAGTDDQNGQYAGSAYIFERSEGGADNWGQVAKLLPKDPAPHDFFGLTLAASGDVAVVGAIGDQLLGLSAGSAYVFYRDFGGANSWGQISKLIPSDLAPLDEFGFPAIQGDTIVVGATKGTLPGAAYVFVDTLAYAPKTYCTSKTTSVGACAPFVESIGVASASSSSGFMVQAKSVPGGSTGVFLYTHEGCSPPRPLPFGILCIDSHSLYKTTPLAGGGTPGKCDGTLSFDWNEYAKSVILTDPLSTQPGTMVDGQFWHRNFQDPGSSYLTEAITFTICR